jgi:hypothetical protein
LAIERLRALPAIGDRCQAGASRMRIGADGRDSPSNSISSSEALSICDDEVGCERRANFCASAASVDPHKIAAMAPQIAHLFESCHAECIESPSIVLSQARTRRAFFQTARTIGFHQPELSSNSTKSEKWSQTPQFNGVHPPRLRRCLPPTSQLAWTKASAVTIVRDRELFV